MRNQLLKKLSMPLCLGLALFGMSHRAAGQLSVGPSGLPAQTFDALPLAADWSTLSVGPGNVPGSAVSTGTQMDSVVQSNAATRVNLTLPTSSTVPPAASGFAQWNSAGLYLQTRANTNWYTLLMGTLRNNTGSNVVSITVSYNLATAAGSVAEEIPGHRAYYSFTGATGTWVRIPAFDSAAGIDNSSKSAVLSLGVWAANASLYILWADDNANAAATQEGAYSIDNFAVTAVPAQPGPPTIATQPQSQTVGFPNSVAFSVNANGTVPLSYQWFKNGTLISGATGSTYTINNATLVDQGSYLVVVSNSLGTATSSNATLAVTCSAGAPPTITTQPLDRSLNSGATLSLSVTASGTGPLAYQWYRSGSLIPGATSATYNKVNAQDTDSGLYTVVVKNCNGPVTSREAVVSISGVGYVLMGLTNHVWRYNQGSNLGTDWRAVGYNDAGWPTGRGLLAFEDNAALTPLINTVTDNGPAGNALPTHYYRTTFNLTNDPATISLVASNYIDDGAVFYVNGVEAFRFNLPGGAIQYGTFAPAANPLNEGVAIVSNIPPSLLVQGVNVLAVEVHQVNATSSDNVFGTALIVNPLVPVLLAITSQPQSITVEESHPAAFTVGVSGAPVYYRWYKDGLAIANATTNPFNIPFTAFSDAGNYLVVVSNFINSVTSSVAALTIVADTNPPTIVDADGTLSPTTVLVTFDYHVLRSTATNIANYRITNTLGGTLTISSAVLTNGSNVLLTTTAPRLINNNYLLIVNNVRDISANQNVIVPNSRFPIRTLVPLIALDSQWKFVDSYPPFDPDPSTYGTAWKEFDFVMGPEWVDGAGVFFNGGDSSVVSGPVNTPLSQTPTINSYFRNTFTFQASPGGLQFFLTHLVDDGAVFYLNGAEFYRFNMPSGPIIHSTLPASIIGNVVREGPFALPASTLRQGSNVMAVELHQTQAVDPDKVFGAQLDASVQSFVVGPVIITGGPTDLFVVEGQPATFQVVQVGGATFQWQQNSNNIAGATNYFYTIPSVSAAMEGTRFRVSVSSPAGGTVFSTNATLRVVSDTNPPTLVKAVIGSNNTIVVSFSETLAAASANNRSNYVVTNAAGAVIAVSSAALSNGTNVILSFATALGGRYTVVVNDVTDAATIPNEIAPNSAVTVGADYFIAFNSAWRYLIANTNETTQSTFMGTNFNDASWSGPSNGLFYVEGAALDGPKNTALVLRDGANNYINTFYFRQKLVTPIVAPTMTIRLRHIIDDGLVLHLNGREIYRSALMPAGAITAASQATAAVGDAALIGPIDIVVTNLVGGTNVFAADVHQSGGDSSDVVFGVELSFGIPSVVIPPPPAVQIVTQPQSRTNAVGQTATFTVGASGALPIFYQWRRNGINISSGTNPSATNATLSLTSVQLGDSGSTYTVVVTNSVNSVTSSIATLTVTNTGTGCQPINWTDDLRFATNGTNWVSATRNGNVTTTILSWTNPATNSCGSNAVVVLQRALTLGNVFPVPSTLWTNIYTNVFGYARVTNSVTNSNEAYYRLRVQ